MPTFPDAFTDLSSTDKATTGLVPVVPSDINDIHAAVDNLEQKLGLGFIGEYDSLVDRLAAIGAGSGVTVRHDALAAADLTEVAGGAWGKLCSSVDVVSCVNGYIVHFQTRQDDPSANRNFAILLDGASFASPYPEWIAFEGDKVMSFTLVVPASAGPHTIDVWTYAGNQFTRANLHFTSGERDNVTKLTVIGF